MNDVVWVAIITASAGAVGAVGATAATVWTAKGNAKFHREDVAIDRVREDWLTDRKFQIDQVMRTSDGLTDFVRVTIQAIAYRRNAISSPMAPLRDPALDIELLEIRPRVLGSAARCADDETRRLVDLAIVESMRAVDGPITNVTGHSEIQMSKSVSDAQNRLGEVLRELHRPQVLGGK